MTRRYLYPEWDVDERSGESYESDPVYMDWVRVRQVLQHEDYLLIERAKLLFAVQTILSAMIYFVMSSGSATSIFPSILCFSGAVMSLHLTIGMYKAKVHQNKIIDWWFSRVGWNHRTGVSRFLYPFIFLSKKIRIGGFEEVEEESGNLPDLMRRQPPVAGKDPGINHLSWSLPYWCIGGMFFVIWLFAFIAFTFGNMDSFVGFKFTIEKI